MDIDHDLDRADDVADDLKGGDAESFIRWPDPEAPLANIRRYPCLAAKEQEIHYNHRGYPRGVRPQEDHEGHEEGKESDLLGVAVFSDLRC